MPVYLYRCPDCGAKHERYFSFEDYVSEIPCRCGSVARRRFTSPEVVATGTAEERMYDRMDDGLGIRTTSRKDRREKMKAASDRMTRESGVEVNLVEAG